MPTTVNNATSLNISQNYNSSGYVANESLQDSQLFLKMLTVSMTNQDPTNPTDGNEFLNQMLQYTTMETLTSVTASVNSLVEMTKTANMYNVIGNAITLTGKEVTMLVPAGTNGSTEDKYVTGIVDKVSLDENGIWIEIDGIKYQYDNLSAVSNNN